MNEKNKGLANDGYQPRLPNKNQNKGSVNGGYTPSKQISPPSPPPKKP